MSLERRVILGTPPVAGGQPGPITVGALTGPLTLYTAPPSSNVIEITLYALLADLIGLTGTPTLTITQADGTIVTLTLDTTVLGVLSLASMNSRVVVGPTSIVFENVGGVLPLGAALWVAIANY